MSLEMAQKVIVPKKKIMSRSFLNSGTLIVILWVEHPLCLSYILYSTITLQNLSTYILYIRFIVGASFFTQRHIYDSLYCKTLAFAISLLISPNGEAMLLQAMDEGTLKTPIP
jgi:hypothetical protein